MKRFWLVLLSLGLVMAFSVSAYAVDVKVGAEYYVGGLYLNRVSVDNSDTNPSTAFFYQRLRVGTDFIVSPSLKLVTQFDAMERIWGGVRSNTWAVNEDYMFTTSAGTRAETENIAMRLGYIAYTSPIGLFNVGYQEDYHFGTVFADRASGPPSGQIQYFIQSGPFVGFLGYAKEVSQRYSDVTYNYQGPLPVYGNSLSNDVDWDSYRIAGIYMTKSLEAGALFMWERNATNKSISAYPWGYMQNVYLIDPYVKAKIGPVALQAELLYFFGDATKWEDNAPSTLTGGNVSISSLLAFVDATANFGMVYAGGSVAYLEGQDPNNTSTIQGGVVPFSGGLDWNPCLIMFNTETMGYWVGGIWGNGDTVVDNEMTNAWFFQGRVGVKPIPQLDVMLSVSYAFADKKPANYPDGTYGTEIDVTGTYKITNNLSYMLGAGYLFTGDYFKAEGGSNQTNDDFILINKLTLSF